MPELKTYRVFISHAWDYGGEYYRLVNMLNNAPRFYWYNYSVPRHDPEDTRTKRQLVKALHDQIRPTNIVIIIAGMYANYRYWIQKEIDIAVEMNKPIIAVAPWGSQRLPQEVQEVADEIVGWNTQSIVGAIRQYAL